MYNEVPHAARSRRTPTVSIDSSALEHNSLFTMNTTNTRQMRLVIGSLVETAAATVSVTVDL